MPGHTDPATGEWVSDDDEREPAPGGLADQQEEAADSAPPPPDYSTPPHDEPGDEGTPPEPGALPLATAEPPAEDPAQIPVGGTTTPDDDIESAIAGEGPPLDLTPTPEASNLPPAGPDDAIPPDATLVPEAPKPFVVGATAEERMAQQGQITAEHLAATGSKGEENVAAAKDKAKHANEVVAINQDFAKRAQDVVKKGEDDLAAGRARRDDEFNKYRAMGERDSWGDHSTAKKILAGIAIILGGRRAAALVIGAAQGFEEKKKEELALQKVAMEKAGHDVAEIDAKIKQDTENIAVQKAAGLQNSADRLSAELASRGATTAQINANEDLNAIKEAALKTRRQVEIDAHKWEEQKIKDGLEKSKAESTIKLNEAHAKYYDRMPVKKGGGGGGGSGSDEALIRKMVSEGKTGEEIAKATPGVAAKDRIKIMASEEGLARERNTTAGTLSSEMNNALKPVTEKGGIREAQEHLKASLNKLEKNPNNPTEWTNATDAMIRSATGRAAILSQYNLYVGHSGGTWDQAESWFQKAKDGNFGSGVQKNLLGSMRASLAEAQRQGGEQERSFRETYENDPRVMNNPAARARYEALHKSVFGSLNGGENISRGDAKPSAGSESPAKPKGPPPLQYNPQSTTDRALATKARMTKPGDPNYASAQRWLSAHGLQQ